MMKVQYSENSDKTVLKDDETFYRQIEQLELTETEKELQAWFATQQLIPSLSY